MKKLALFLLLLCAVSILGWLLLGDRVREVLPTKHVPGAPLDSIHGVVVYDNSGFSGNSGRNVVDGYNIGLKYQCVEFVKRYYFERFDHRMPNSYGHAKNFFDSKLVDGMLNPDRGLLQFRNGSASMPQVDDLLVLDGWRGNPYGQPAPVPEPGWPSSAV